MCRLSPLITVPPSIGLRPASTDVPPSLRPLRSMPIPKPPIDFDVLEKSIYAQGAEEAMLGQIFERIGTKSRYCVEFGASDGLRNSNTARFLLEDNWTGAFIEGSEYRFGRLKNNWEKNDRASLLRAKLTPENIDSILAKGADQYRLAFDRCGWQRLLALESH